MRKALRIVGWIAAALALVVVLAVAIAYPLTVRRANRVWQVSTPAIAVPNDPDAVARGRRIVTVLAQCVDCHGPDLGGKEMVDSPIMGRLWAANLTRGRGGVGSAYTATDWARVLLHGVKRDGRSVVFMPSQDYHFTGAEVADIVAFLRSVPPIDRDRPSTRFGPMAAVMSFTSLPLFPAELIDHGRAHFEQPVVAASVSDEGRALAQKAVCTACHGPDFAGGGGPPPGAANLTPVGIGHYTEADFVRAIREHVRPNGSKIDDAMPAGYAQLTDKELHAIFSYLKTVPPKGEKTKRQM